MAYAYNSKYAKNSPMEELLVKYIGEDVCVYYCFAGRNGQECDEGMLIEVGRGYIILEISDDATSIVNLENVASIEINNQ